MDMDTHRLIDMLPDREADTFADWPVGRSTADVIMGRYPVHGR
jgi:hypothetical protein